MSDLAHTLAATTSLATIEEHKKNIVRHTAVYEAAVAAEHAAKLAQKAAEARREGIRAALQPRPGLKNSLKEAILNGETVTDADLHAARVAQSNATRKWLAASATASAAKAELEAAQTALAEAEATEQPAQGFEREIQGLGYKLVFGGKDPKGGCYAYRVIAGGHDVGWLRREDENRWVLYSTTDAFSESLHRNVVHAQTKLEVVYEPAEA